MLHDYLRCDLCDGFCFLCSCTGFNVLYQTEKLLVNDIDNDLHTPLHMAAFEGHTEAASILIDSGADMDLR